MTSAREIGSFVSATLGQAANRDSS